MHILVPLWHCAGTVCSLRFVKVFGKKSREWISRQNNATSATKITTTRGGSVDGQTASIITALHAVTAKNTLRIVCMCVWMYICMYNCTFGKRVDSHEQPLTHTLSDLARPRSLSAHPFSLSQSSRRTVHLVSSCGSLTVGTCSRKQLHCLLHLPECCSWPVSKMWHFLPTDIHVAFYRMHMSLAISF